VFVSGYEIERPVEDDRLMDRMPERENVMSALRRVEANRGSAGAGGILVIQLRSYLKGHWPCIRAQLLTGQYNPLPVRRVELPKPGGGIRKLGFSVDLMWQLIFTSVIRPAP
jgi:RNA-directed DNA polymerase